MTGGFKHPVTARPTPWEMVGEFHAAFGLPIRPEPAELSEHEAALRQRLLDEEVEELRAAVAASDVVRVADALADIVYIACGTAHCYGIHLDDVLQEVHRSNMTKLGPGGPVYREDGKVLKGPGYQPPDIARIVAGRQARQAPESEC